MTWTARMYEALHARWAREYAGRPTPRLSRALAYLSARRERELLRIVERVVGLARKRLGDRKT